MRLWQDQSYQPCHYPTAKLVNRNHVSSNRVCTRLNFDSDVLRLYNNQLDRAKWWHDIDIAEIYYIRNDTTGLATSCVWEPETLTAHAQTAHIYINLVVWCVRVFDCRYYTGRASRFNVLFDVARVYDLVTFVCCDVLCCAARTLSPCHAPPALLPLIGPAIMFSLNLLGSLYHGCGDQLTDDRISKSGWPCWRTQE